MHLIVQYALHLKCLLLNYCICNRRTILILIFSLSVQYIATMGKEDVQDWIFLDTDHVSIIFTVFMHCLARKCHQIFKRGYL